VPTQADCAAALPLARDPLVPTDPFFADFTIVDAQPLPVTRDECRQGGWMGYGYASGAACRADVRDRALEGCNWERWIYGNAAFSAKYGRNAVRRCIRLRINA
jgi:hypothetical protein